MTSDLRETRLASPVYRPAKWLVRTLVCQPDRHGSLGVTLFVICPKFRQSK